MATKRLIKELDAYNRDPSSPAVAELYPLRDDDLMELRAVLRGPEGTGYEGICPHLTSPHAHSPSTPPSNERTIKQTKTDLPPPGGRFSLSISIPPNYPSAPPAVTFLTPTIHPNISFSTGEICLDLLKTSWTPAYGLVSTLEAVAQLMASGGEAESPLNLDVGRMVREGDWVGVGGLVRLMTGRYAMGE